MNHFPRLQVSAPLSVVWSGNFGVGHERHVEEIVAIIARPRPIMRRGRVYPFAVEVVEVQIPHGTADSSAWIGRVMADARSPYRRTLRRLAVARTEGEARRLWKREMEREGQRKADKAAILREREEEIREVKASMVRKQAELDRIKTEAETRLREAKIEAEVAVETADRPMRDGRAANLAVARKVRAADALAAARKALEDATSEAGEVEKRRKACEEVLRRDAPKIQEALDRGDAPAARRAFAVWLAAMRHAHLPMDAKATRPSTELSSAIREQRKRRSANVHDIEIARGWIVSGYRDMSAKDFARALSRATGKIIGAEAAQKRRERLGLFTRVPMGRPGAKFRSPPQEG